MLFRSLFRRGSAARFRRRDAQTAARFLLDPKHFNAGSGRVKPRAFYPARIDNRVSVFCIDELPEAEIWAIGTRYVALPRARPLLGRADLTDREISSVGDLHLDRDDRPPRHASIAGWPPAKDECKSLAQELAALAKLRLCDAA